MSDPKISELKKLGFNSDLSEGVITALQSYENVDFKKYVQIIKESLEFINPDKKKALEKIKKTHDKKLKENKEEKDLITYEEETEKFKKIENNILEIIKQNEDEEGASWDSIIDKCHKTGIDKDSIEEAINSLMDKGLIFEPILGIIKTT
jgi:DNA replicative helicase MCM subunit Mcm2 (Cdc46/Mcm family)